MRRILQVFFGFRYILLFGVIFLTIALAPFYTNAEIGVVTCAAGYDLVNNVCKPSTQVKTVTGSTDTSSTAPKTTQTDTSDTKHCDITTFQKAGGGTASCYEPGVINQIKATCTAPSGVPTCAALKQTATDAMGGTGSGQPQSPSDIIFGNEDLPKPTGQTIPNSGQTPIQIVPTKVTNTPGGLDTLEEMIGLGGNGVVDKSSSWIPGPATANAVDYTKFTPFDNGAPLFDMATVRSSNGNDPFYAGVMANLFNNFDNIPLQFSPPNVGDVLSGRIFGPPSTFSPVGSSAGFTPTPGTGMAPGQELVTRSVPTYSLPSNPLQAAYNSLVTPFVTSSLTSSPLTAGTAIPFSFNDPAVQAAIARQQLQQQGQNSVFTSTDTNGKFVLARTPESLTQPLASDSLTDLSALKSLSTDSTLLDAYAPAVPTLSSVPDPKGIVAINAETPLNADGSAKRVTTEDIRTSFEQGDFGKAIAEAGRGLNQSTRDFLKAIGVSPVPVADLGARMINFGGRMSLGASDIAANESAAQNTDANNGDQGTPGAPSGLPDNSKDELTPVQNAAFEEYQNAQAVVNDQGITPDKQAEAEEVLAKAETAALKAGVNLEEARPATVAEKVAVLTENAKSFDDLATSLEKQGRAEEADAARAEAKSIRETIDTQKTVDLVEQQRLVEGRAKQIEANQTITQKNLQDLQALKQQVTAASPSQEFRSLTDGNLISREKYIANIDRQIAEQEGAARQYASDQSANKATQDRISAALAVQSDADIARAERMVNDPTYELRRDTALAEIDRQTAQAKNILDNPDNTEARARNSLAQQVNNLNGIRSIVESGTSFPADAMQGRAIAAQASADALKSELGNLDQSSPEAVALRSRIDGYESTARLYGQEATKLNADAEIITRQFEADSIKRDLAALNKDREQTAGTFGDKVGRLFNSDERAVVAQKLADLDSKIMATKMELAGTNAEAASLARMRNDLSASELDRRAAAGYSVDGSTIETPNPAKLAALDSKIDSLRDGIEARVSGAREEAIYNSAATTRDTIIARQQAIVDSMTEKLKADGFSNAISNIELDREQVALDRLKSASIHEYADLQRFSQTQQQEAIAASESAMEKAAAMTERARNELSKPNISAAEAQKWSTVLKSNTDQYDQLLNIEIPSAKATLNDLESGQLSDRQSIIIADQLTDGVNRPQWVQDLYAIGGKTTEFKEWTMENGFANAGIAVGKVWHAPATAIARTLGYADLSDPAGALDSLNPLADSRNRIMGAIDATMISPTARLAFEAPFLAATALRETPALLRAGGDYLANGALTTERLVGTSLSSEAKFAAEVAVREAKADLAYGGYGSRAYVAEEVALTVKGTPEVQAEVRAALVAQGNPTVAGAIEAATIDASAAVKAEAAQVLQAASVEANAAVAVGKIAQGDSVAYRQAIENAANAVARTTAPETEAAIIKALQASSGETAIGRVANVVKEAGGPDLLASAAGDAVRAAKPTQIIVATAEEFRAIAARNVNNSLADAYKTMFGEYPIGSIRAFEAKFPVAERAGLGSALQSNATLARGLSTDAKVAIGTYENAVAKAGTDALRLEAEAAAGRSAVLRANIQDALATARTDLEKFGLEPVGKGVGVQLKEGAAVARAETGVIATEKNLIRGITPADEKLVQSLPLAGRTEARNAITNYRNQLSLIEKSPSSQEVRSATTLTAKNRLEQVGLRAEGDLGAVKALPEGAVVKAQKLGTPIKDVVAETNEFSKQVTETLLAQRAAIAPSTLKRTTDFATNISAAIEACTKGVACDTRAILTRSLASPAKLFNSASIAVVSFQGLAPTLQVLRTAEITAARAIVLNSKIATTPYMYGQLAPVVSTGVAKASVSSAVRGIETVSATGIKGSAVSVSVDRSAGAIRIAAGLPVIGSSLPVDAQARITAIEDLQNSRIVQVTELATHLERTAFLEPMGDAGVAKTADVRTDQSGIRITNGSEKPFSIGKAIYNEFLGIRGANAEPAAPGSKGGERGLAIISDVSNAYGKYYRFDGNAFAQSMSGVFSREAGGIPNAKNGYNDKYEGSFQLGTNEMRTWSARAAADIQAMQAKGIISEKLYQEFLSALKEASAMKDARFHHVLNTWAALAEHARYEKNIQVITPDPMQRTAFHQGVQLSPTKVKAAISSGKDLALDGASRKAFGGQNGITGVSTVFDAVQKMAGNHKTYPPSFAKGINDMNKFLVSSGALPSAQNVATPSTSKPITVVTAAIQKLLGTSVDGVGKAVQATARSVAPQVKQVETKTVFVPIAIAPEFKDVAKPTEAVRVGKQITPNDQPAVIENTTVRTPQIEQAPTKPTIPPFESANAANSGSAKSAQDVTNALAKAGAASAAYKKAAEGMNAALNAGDFSQENNLNALSGAVDAAHKEAFETVRSFVSQAGIENPAVAEKAQDLIKKEAQLQAELQSRKSAARANGVKDVGAILKDNDAYYVALRGAIEEAKTFAANTPKPTLVTPAPAQVSVLADPVLASIKQNAAIPDAVRTALVEARAANGSLKLLDANGKSLGTIAKLSEGAPTTAAQAQILAQKIKATIPDGMHRLGFAIRNAGNTQDIIVHTKESLALTQVAEANGLPGGFVGYSRHYYLPRYGVEANNVFKNAWATMLSNAEAIPGRAGEYVFKSNVDVAKLMQSIPDAETAFDKTGAPNSNLASFQNNVDANLLRVLSLGAALNGQKDIGYTFAFSEYGHGSNQHVNGLAADMMAGPKSTAQFDKWRIKSFGNGVAGNALAAQGAAYQVAADLLGIQNRLRLGLYETPNLHIELADANSNSASTWLDNSPSARNPFFGNHTPNKNLQAVKNTYDRQERVSFDAMTNYREQSVFGSGQAAAAQYAFVGPDGTMSSSFTGSFASTPAKGSPVVTASVAPVVVQPAVTSPKTSAIDSQYYPHWVARSGDLTDAIMSRLPSGTTIAAHHSWPVSDIQRILDFPSKDFRVSWYAESNVSEKQDPSTGMSVKSRIDEAAKKQAQLINSGYPALRFTNEMELDAAREKGSADQIQDAQSVKDAGFKYLAKSLGPDAIAQIRAKFGNEFVTRVVFEDAVNDKSYFSDALANAKNNERLTIVIHQGAYSGDAGATLEQAKKLANTFTQYDKVDILYGQPNDFAQVKEARGSSAVVPVVNQIATKKLDSLDIAKAEAGGVELKLGAHTFALKRGEVNYKIQYTEGNKTADLTLQDYKQMSAAGREKIQMVALNPDGTQAVFSPKQFDEYITDRFIASQKTTQEERLSADIEKLTGQKAASMTKVSGKTATTVHPSESEYTEVITQKGDSVYVRIGKFLAPEVSAAFNACKASGVCAADSKLALDVKNGWTAAAVVDGKKTKVVFQVDSHEIEVAAPKVTPSQSAANKPTANLGQGNQSNLAAARLVGRAGGDNPIIVACLERAVPVSLPSGYTAKIISAARDSSTVGHRSFHVKRDGAGNGLAIDIQIYNERGQALKNIQSPETFAIYRELYQNVKKIQDELFPQLKELGRWGGYFVQGIPQDLMHYDLGPAFDTLAGNWSQGLRAEYAYYGAPGQVGKGMGPIESYQLIDKSGRGVTTASISSKEVPATIAQAPKISLSPTNSYTLAQLRALPAPELKPFVEASAAEAGDRFINGAMLGVIMPVLNEYKTKFGVVPTINGVGRSAAVNAAVGGVEGSDHLSGKAIDFKTIGVSNDRVQWLDQALREKGLNVLTSTHGQGNHTHASLRRTATTQELANLNFASGGQSAPEQVTTITKTEKTVSVRLASPDVSKRALVADRQTGKEVFSYKVTGAEPTHELKTYASKIQKSAGTAVTTARAAVPNKEITTSAIQNRPSVSATIGNTQINPRSGLLLDPKSANNSSFERSGDDDRNFGNSGSGGLLPPFLSKSVPGAKVAAPQGGNIVLIMASALGITALGGIGVYSLEFNKNVGDANAVTPAESSADEDAELAAALQEGKPTQTQAFTPTPEQKVSPIKLHLDPEKGWVVVTEQEVVAPFAPPGDGGGSGGSGGGRERTQQSPMQKAMSALQDMMKKLGGAGKGGGAGAAPKPPTPPVAQPATTNTAPSIQCTPSAVSNDTTKVSVTWSCANSTSSLGNGFTTSGALSGKATTTIMATSSPKVNLSVSCLVNGVVAGVASCAIDVIHPSAAAAANPSTVHRGQSSQIVWTSVQTTGCTVYAPPSIMLISGDSSGRVDTPALVHTSIYKIVCSTMTGVPTIVPITIQVAGDTGAPLEAVVPARAQTSPPTTSGTSAAQSRSPGNIPSTSAVTVGATTVNGQPVQLCNPRDGMTAFVKCISNGKY